MATMTIPEQGIEHDAFPINGTDYVEFYVGNAKQASHYYRAAFGYQLVGYRGPETGVRDRCSYLMQQGKIRLVLTTALHPESPIAAHVHAHPRHAGFGSGVPWRHCDSGAAAIQRCTR